MRATFTSEQEQLAAVALDMGASGLDGARQMVDGGDLPAEPTTSLFSGFGAIGIPEQAGGAGGSLVDVAILVEGLAQTLTPTPYVAHLAALQLAHGAGIELDATQRWTLAAVPAHGAGQIVLTGESPSGTVSAVPDGASSDRTVVLDAAGNAAAATVTAVTARPGFDLTRPAADLAVTATSPVVAAGDGALRAAVVVAADLCGAGRGALAVGAAYASERQQFGQPIGKFQGVAHQLATARAYIEAAWSLTLYAAWALDAGADDAVADAHAAKARASEAGLHAAERSLQVHGGIGMTWEASPHLFVRRTLTSTNWLGGVSSHRRALGLQLLAAS